MAFVSQDRKKRIALAAKPILKKYGIKATFGVDHHTSLVVNIASGNLDFFKNYNETLAKRAYVPVSEAKAEKYMQVNHYHYRDQFTGDALKFLEELIPVLQSENYDNSDPMTDYFDVGYYLSVNIGRWNKPYILEE